MRYEGKPTDGQIVDATGIDLQRDSVLLRRSADVTVVCYPKSGRTWLSYMVTAYVGKFLGHPEIGQHIVDGRLRTLVPERARGYISTVLAARRPDRWAPIIAFEHKVKLSKAAKTKPYQPAPKTHPNFFLVRDPRDVIVSFFHHVVDLYRGKIPGSGGAHRAETDLPSFIRSERVGMPQLVTYLRYWSDWATGTGATVLYYEDFLSHPAASLAAFLTRAGVSSVDDTLVRDVVEETSFDRMKAAEIAAQRGKDDPSKRRMRGGRSGGFRHELSTEDQDYVNQMLEGSMVGPLARYQSA